MRPTHIPGPFDATEPPASSLTTISHSKNSLFSIQTKLKSYAGFGLLMKAKTLGMKPRKKTVKVTSIILAAGKGTRMKSRTPKVLHKIAGRSLLEHVMAAVRSIGSARLIVVLNSETDRFSKFCAANKDVGFAVQVKQQGTADAVGAAGVLLSETTLPDYCLAKRHAGGMIPADEATHLLVCTGDTPCLSGETLKGFVDAFLGSGAALGVIGIDLPNPKGYGRLVLGKGNSLTKIVEEKDATIAERRITLINSGIIIAERKALFDVLGQVTPANQQGEYYLTTIFEIAKRKGLKSFVYKAEEWQEFVGVNDRLQLAQAEEFILARQRNRLLLGGVTLHLPQTVYIETTVEVGTDTVIRGGVALIGETQVGEDCDIGSHSTLINCRVFNGARVGAGSYLENCHIKAETVLAPQTCRIES